VRGRAIPAFVIACVASMLSPSTAWAVSRAAAPPTLEWLPCGAPRECATLTVPLDYADPSGRSIDLAVARVPARHATQRIGSLVLNPGGPGAPVVGSVADAAASMPAVVRDRFDIVAFDPRGVGGSDAVTCPADIDALFDQSFSPSTPAEHDALVAATRTVVSACAQQSGDLLAHVSTLDGARDLDRLRAALGDERLSFLGESYGTYLATQYASQFPRRVRALVLDGAVDPTADGEAIALGQARGFTRALDDFLHHCARRRECVFHHNGHPGAAYDALRARAATTPLATLRNAGRTVNQTRFDGGVVQALYAGRAAWGGLAQALADAEHGNAATLLGYADALATREAGGMRHAALDAYWAISCLDGPPVGDVDAAARLAARAERVSPRFGAFLVNFSLACSVWPVAPAWKPSARVHGAPPVFVLGNTGDPVTPLASARALERVFEHSALLVADGEQHGSFAVGNACVDAAVTRYLVDGVTPRSGAHCGATGS
jgi:pimeloyl-ACP methyl ester carboxylesterase